MSSPIFDLALEVSEPSKYDTIPPDSRAAALEEALTSMTNSSATPIETLFTTPTCKKVVLRAICDPWSATRKKMRNILINKIIAGKSSSSSSIIEWIKEACEEILTVVDVDDTATHQKKETPWYAVDGFLLFLKMFIDRDDDREDSDEKSSSNRQQKQQTEKEWNQLSSFFIRMVLPHCVHVQECVRDTAADIVVFLLIASKNDNESDSNDSDQECCISLQSILDSIVTKEIDLPCQWWTQCGPKKENHMIDLGKLALANRGLGIDLLFRKGDEAKTNTASTTLLDHWASSKHASVRYACSSLFTKSDALANNNKNKNSLVVFDNHLLIDEGEFHDRLFHLAINDWLLSPSSSLQKKETAAIAASDLLKQFLPKIFRQFENDDLLLSPDHEKELFSSIAEILMKIEEMGSSTTEADLIHEKQSLDLGEDIRFDVKRACAELLPILCEYFVVVSSDFTTIVDVIVQIIVARSCQNQNGDRCCKGVPQLGDASSSPSCCALQNLFWFLILKKSFDDFVNNHPHQNNNIHHHQGALTSSSAFQKLRQAILDQRDVICPRVKLMFNVYHRGLFPGDATDDGIIRDELPLDENDRKSSPPLLACDVRWIADWIRMNPLDVLASSSSDGKNGIIINSLLEYSLSNFRDSFVQELIFTSIHDVAHIYAALLLHQKESVVNTSSVSPFLFAMDSSRFAPPTLQQDGSDALIDGTAWIQAIHNDNYTSNSAASSPQRSLSRSSARRGSFVTQHLSALLKSGNNNGNNDNGDDGFHSHNSWCQKITAKDGDKLRLCIEKLSKLSANLLSLLLLSSAAASSMTTRNLELSSLTRAADATRSLTRAVDELATTTTKSTADDVDKKNVSSTITDEKSHLLMMGVLRPWFLRLQIIFENSKVSSPNSGAASGAPKKASESNWDDSSSSDEEELLEAKDLEGNVGSSVTKDQERDCFVSAMKHLSHILAHQQQQKDHQNNNSNNNHQEEELLHNSPPNDAEDVKYNPERVRFVTEFVSNILMKEKNSFDLVVEKVADRCKLLEYVTMTK